MKTLSPLGRIVLVDAFSLLLAGKPADFLFEIFYFVSYEERITGWGSSPKGWNFAGLGKSWPGADAPEARLF